MANGITITIDGPAAAGKSSVAKRVAQKLGFLYIDTGAMYRCLTYKLLQQKIGIEDEPQINQILDHTSIRLSHDRFYLDGVDVTDFIRSDLVTLHVSRVSAYPSVRMTMVHKQRDMAKHGNVVLDGRDIGSFVLPHAELKIYQTASVETRALRRYKEMEMRGTPTMTLSEVEDDIRRRDTYDSTRTLAPLVVPENAIIIDTSHMEVEQTVEMVIRLAQQKMGELVHD